MPSTEKRKRRDRGAQAGGPCSSVSRTPDGEVRRASKRSACATARPPRLLILLAQCRLTGRPQQALVVTSAFSKHKGFVMDRVEAGFAMMALTSSVVLIGALAAMAA